MLHPDAKERDNLLNILFNLIKKPDEEQRWAILIYLSYLTDKWFWVQDVWKCWDL